jgi:hypothetical protein
MLAHQPRRFVLVNRAGAFHHGSLNIPADIEPPWRPSIG